MHRDLGSRHGEILGPQRPRRAGCPDVGAREGQRDSPRSAGQGDRAGRTWRRKPAALAWPSAGRVAGLLATNAEAARKLREALGDLSAHRITTRQARSRARWMKPTASGQPNRSPCPCGQPQRRQSVFESAATSVVGPLEQEFGGVQECPQPPLVRRRMPRGDTDRRPRRARIEASGHSVSGIQGSRPDQYVDLSCRLPVFLPAGSTFCQPRRPEPHVAAHSSDHRIGSVSDPGIAARLSEPHPLRPHFARSSSAGHRWSAARDTSWPTRITSSGRHINAQICAAGAELQHRHGHRAERSL